MVEAGNGLCIGSCAQEHETFDVTLNLATEARKALDSSPINRRVGCEVRFSDAETMFSSASALWSTSRRETATRDPREDFDALAHPAGSVVHLINDRGAVEVLSPSRLDPAPRLRGPRTLSQLG